MRIRPFDVLAGILVAAGSAAIAAQLRQIRREERRDALLARMAGQPTKRIVVVGAGFAGLTAMNHLASLIGDDPSTELILVDRHNYHLFYPLLYQVATGGVEPGSLALPVRIAARERGYRFMEATIRSIDLENKRLETDTGSIGSIPFDSLIFAPGSVTNFFGMADAAQNTIPLKSLEDGLVLRNRIIEAFERADVEHDPDLRRMLLSFVIVGGGATGVELAASLSDMIFKTLLPNYQSISANEIRLAIIEARGSILAGWNPRMAELATHRLTRRHVEIMVNTTVSRVTDSAVETNEGQHIPTATVAWAAGVRPEPTVSSLPVPKERDGRIRVDENLEIPGHPGVFVIGDAAAVVPAGASRPLPPTAAVAVDEGPVSAKNAVRRLTDQPLQPFHYRSRGDLVSLGRGAAAADIYGVVFDGIPAWLVRRMVYLINLVGFRNRLFVVIDWVFVSFHQRVITSFDSIGLKRLVPKTQQPSPAETRVRRT